MRLPLVCYHVRMEYGDERLPERYWSKVHPCPNTGCWLWGASTTARGYPQIYWEGKLRLAVPVMCEKENGPRPKGYEVRHLCGVRYCVNPSHLVWGTSSENNYDTVRHGTHHNARKTHCKNGHEFDEKNTVVRLKPNGQTRRGCRVCQRAAQSKYYYKDSYEQ